MLKFLVSYGVLELAVVVLAVGTTLWARRRRLRARDRRSLAGLERTEEVSIDPTTGIVQRVWFDPRSGERRYVTEGEAERPRHGPRRSG